MKRSHRLRLSAAAAFVLSAPFALGACMGYPAQVGTGQPGAPTMTPPDSSGESRLPGLLSQLQSGSAGVELFDGTESQVLAAQDAQDKGVDGTSTPGASSPGATSTPSAVPPISTPAPGSSLPLQPPATPTPTRAAVPSAISAPAQSPTPTATPTPTMTPTPTLTPTRIATPSVESTPPSEGSGSPATPTIAPPTEG